MWLSRLTRSLLLCMLTAGVSSQIGDCPFGWLSHQQGCYEFLKDPIALYEEADKICKGKGAALVSVNTPDEHRFIDQEIRRIDVERRYTWWTSGSDINNVVKWEGDGQFAVDATVSFWMDSAHLTNPAIHIVYRYSYRRPGFWWVKQFRNVKSNYICEIPLAEVHRLVQDSRDFTFGTNVIDPDNVEKGPTFVIQPKDIVITARTLSASIECMASGNPQPEYRWYKGDNLQNEVVAAQSITITNGKLTFDNVTETSTSGPYQCVAFNKFGSALSNLVHVTYGYLREYSNVAPGAVNASQYQGTYLNCNPPSHKPDATFQWMRFGKHGMEFLLPQLNNYYFISQGGNLFFSEVQATDTGYYYCSVTLSAGQTGSLATDQPVSALSLGIKLDVGSQSAAEYPPEIHDGFPIVYPKNPIRGMTIYIECLAYGRLPLHYMWSRKDKPMPSRARTVDLNRVLVIESVMLEDEGTYECLVTSTRAGSAARADYSLSIGSKPYFVSPLKNIHADVNSELTWRCEAIAVPRATFIWYKDTQPLVGIPGQIDITSNVLKISHLDATRDSGMYQCAAKNTHGVTLSDAQLRVLSVKPSFMRHPIPTSMFAAMNGNLTIPCRPEAAPTPVIRWLRNGAEIGQRQGMEVLYNGDLRITGVQQQDGGLYTCEATNANGQAQSHCTVTVIDHMVFIHTPINTDVDYNNTAFLQCDVSYDHRYDLIYRWTRNGRVINATSDPHYRIGVLTNTRGLYVHYADFDHTGYYECQAMTTASIIKRGATLTVKGPPGEPSGVYADILSRTPHSLRLKWTPPPNHGSPVVYYFIEAKTAYNNTWRTQLANISDLQTLIQDSSQSDKRTFIVTGLKPSNSYAFRIRAMNAYPVPGPYSLPSDWYRLDGAAPVVAPKQVAGGGGTVGVLTIIWQPLPREDWGGSTVSYIVYWRLKDDTSAYKQVHVTGNISQHVEDVGLINYYIQYEVIVGGVNEYGAGPNSSVYIVYSAEGMPNYVPKNIRGNEINGTAIHVTWDPVPNTRLAMKGTIQGFEINVVDFNVAYRKSTTTYVYGVQTGGTAIGLEPNSDYWFTVQVFNTAGESNPSERYRISTYLSAPLLYPEYVSISSHGSESVAVQWRGISTGLQEESIVGYKLEYWPRGDSYRTALSVKTDSKMTNAVIYGIQKDTIYSLRVLGYSRGGYGKKSPTQYFTLGGQVPLDPTTSFKILIGGSDRIAPSVVILLLISAMLQCL